MNYWKSSSPSVLFVPKDIVRGHTTFPGGDACSLLDHSSAAWAWVVLFPLPIFPLWSLIQPMLLPLQFPLHGYHHCHLCGHPSYLFAWVLSPSTAWALYTASCTWRAAHGCVYSWAWVDPVMTCPLTWQGTIICCILSSWAAGIVRVWEGQVCFFFSLKKIHIIILWIPGTSLAREWGCSSSASLSTGPSMGSSWASALHLAIHLSESICLESQHKSGDGHVDGHGGGRKSGIAVASWVGLDTFILGLFLHRKFRRVTGQISWAGSCETNLKDSSEWIRTVLISKSSHFQENLEALWVICALKSMVADSSQLYWVPHITGRERNNWNFT